MSSATVARRGIPLGRPLGIPVYLAPSWLLIGAFVAWSMAPRVAEALPRVSTGASYGVGAVCALLLAVSVLAHELGHSAVSLAMGIPIRRITLFVLGGVAEIDREPETAAREYLVAIAGPVVSLLLAGSGLAGGKLAGETVAGFVLLTLAEVNLLLAAFNLLPGLPLDGGRVLRAAIWAATGDRRPATLIAVRTGQAIALVVAALGIALVLVGDGGGAFLVVIAAFIWVSGVAGLRRSEQAVRLAALATRAFARPSLPVPAELPLAEALRRANAAGCRVVVVDGAGRPDALLSAPAVEAVPPARRAWVTVGEVARRIVAEPGLVLSAELRGAELVEAMKETPASEYLVVERDGGVLGVLSTRDVKAFLT